MNKHGEGADGVEAIWVAHHSHLVDLAFRMLGRIHDAEDVVQEAFSRLLVADIDGIEDIRGWLVVVVSRLCLDQLRSARHRREATVGSVDDAGMPGVRGAPGVRGVGLSVPPVADPADRVTLDDSIRLALVVLLEELSPAERAVFVLHDVFRYSFDAIAPIVGRSPAACRQIASRARRRIESETGPARFTAGAGEQHQVAAEFIAACAGRDLDRLLLLLDPDVVGDVDLGPEIAPRLPLRGSHIVSRNILKFFGPAPTPTLVSQPVNGHPGALAFREGQLAAILVFKVRDNRIYDIHAVRDPAKLALVGRQLSLEG